METPKTKVCSNCGEEKPLEEFHRNKKGKDGIASVCKVCRSKYSRDRKDLPIVKERHRKNSKTWRKNNRKMKQEYTTKYFRKMRKESASFYIRDKIGSSILRKIKRGHGNKSHHTMDLIGCSIDFLKDHLQQTAIKNGYLDFDINNYSGRQYHIDHIIPCSSFDLTKEEEQLKCFHYSNLQILTAKANMEKSDKILAA